MSHNSVCSHISEVLIYSILIVMPIFTHGNTRSIEAMQVHHLILKRQTSSLPQAETHHNKNNNHEAYKNDSEHNASRKNSTRLFAITSQISNTSGSNGTSSLRNLHTIKQESDTKTTSAVSKSLVQSSLTSKANCSNLSTILKSTPVHSHSHHHHNRSHQHHHHNQSSQHHHHNQSHLHHHHNQSNQDHYNYKPMGKAHERDNHKHLDHKQEKTHGHDNQNPNHHHHHHHHHEQNENRREKTSSFNVTIPKSPRSTKQFIQSLKTESLAITSLGSTIPTVTKLMNVKPKTMAVQTSRSISPITETFITRKMYSNIHGASTVAQRTTTISHQSITTRPAMKSLNTQPATLPTTKNETLRKSSGVASATFKLKDKNITSSSSWKSTSDKIFILPTLKSTENIVTETELKATDKVNKSTLQPGVKISSTLNPTVSALKPTEKVDINNVNISTPPKLVDEVGTLSTQKRANKADNLSTLNPNNTVDTSSFFKSTNRNVTTSKLKSKDRSAGSISGTIKLATVRASKMTEVVGKKESGTTPTINSSSDTYTSNSAMINDTSSSIAPMKEVTKANTINATQNMSQIINTISSQTYLYKKQNLPNVSSTVLTKNAKLKVTTFKYSEKNQTLKTNEIFMTSKPDTKEPIGGNRTSIFKTKVNSTVLTSTPSTEYFMTTQKISAILVNSTRSSLNPKPINNSKSAIVGNDTLYFPSQESPYYMKNVTNSIPVSNEDENTTTFSSCIANSNTFSVNESSPSAQQLENTEKYMSDLDQNNTSDASINRTMLDDIRLINDTDTLLLQSNATDVKYTVSNTTTQSSSSSKRSRGSRSRRTYNSHTPSSTYTDNWQSNITIQGDWNVSSLGGGGGYSNDYVTNNASTDKSLNFDVTSTSTSYIDYNDGSSAQSSTDKSLNFDVTSTSTPYIDYDDGSSAQSSTDKSLNFDVTSTSKSYIYYNDGSSAQSSTDKSLNFDVTSTSTSYIYYNDGSSAQSTTDKSLNFDVTSTSTSYIDYNGGSSAQSSNSYWNKDLYNYDDITTPKSTYDVWGIQSTFGNDDDIRNVDNDNDYDYDTNTEGTYKTYTKDYDETFGTSTQSTYPADEANDEYEPRTKSNDGYDYNDEVDPSTRSAYYALDNDNNYDLSTRSTHDYYKSDYDNSNDLSMRSNDTYYDDLKSKDTFDIDDNDDYDVKHRNIDDVYSSRYVQTQTNLWQDEFDYTPSPTGLTKDEFKSDKVMVQSEVTKRNARNLGTVSVTTKSPFYGNTDYFNFTNRHSKRRWYGYTNTIPHSTVTETPYTGPSTRRRETIIHETVTRFMPGGIKYRYSKVHCDDSNCEIFNPWSHPPDLSTLFDYYKFRRVHYSKTQTFWEDIKHYFVKFVRIFKKNFRKGKPDG